MTRAARRGLGAAALALAVVVGWPGAASAAGGRLTVTASSGPLADGAVLTANDTLQVQGRLDAGTGSSSLVIESPDQVRHSVATGNAPALTGSSTLSFSLDTACVAYAGGGSCSGYQPGLNGVWTVSLTGGETDQTTFVLRAPPAQVQGVRASADGSAVVVGWQPGVEPDLRSYQVYLDGKPLGEPVTPAQACQSGAGCSASFSLGSAATGTHSFTVRSARATCPGCTDTVSSPDSAPAEVRFASVSGSSSSSPTPTATGGSGSTTSTTGTASTGGRTTTSGGGTTGGSTPSRGASSGGGGQALAQTFTRFNPTVKAPAPPDVPTTMVAPLPEGTYRPQLAYPEQTVRDKEVTVVPGQRHPAPVAAAADTPYQRPIWPSVAGALLLVMLAAHLRAWLHRSAPAD